MEGPFEPVPGRKIVICLSDGKLYHLSVLEFVVMQTKEALEIVLGRVPTGEEIGPQTGVGAASLVEDGWFAPEEYIEEWTQMQVEDMDDEINSLLGGPDEAGNETEPTDA